MAAGKKGKGDGVFLMQGTVGNRGTAATKDVRQKPILRAYFRPLAKCPALFSPILPVDPKISLRNNDRNFNRYPQRDILPLTKSSDKSVDTGGEASWLGTLGSM